MESVIPLKVSGLSINLGKRSLLSGIDLDLNAGEFISLMGENGVGKTNLARSHPWVSENCRWTGPFMG